MTVKIEVFTSPTCPYCPRAVQLVQTVAPKFGEKVSVEEINTWTPEGQLRIRRYGIYAVPTIVINGKVHFVGVPSEQELSQAISIQIAASEVLNKAGK